MPLQSWYQIAEPREEVRGGRSFNPDEFAIALEQVVAGTAPEDYKDPEKFFARTCLTGALREHISLVLRRLNGETQNAPADLTLITQFGGGKTHTLTALYHLASNPAECAKQPEVRALLKSLGLKAPPAARVAVFVGNAWDPSPGRETPWLDMARQLAGSDGAEILGDKARTAAPGTDNLRRLFDRAGGPVLLLFDEVLNFVARHRDLADGFYSFLDNTVRAMTSARGCACVLSLPRSAVEMTESDQVWLDRISKAVHRVSKDLIANDEAEIAEVVRRRLFASHGTPKSRRAAAAAYANWCFDHRNELPPEWTAADAATTDSTARERLTQRFEAAFPFHPATISVFQRKWQGLPQFQRTRGTLAMLAQWISLVGRDSYRRARREPLLTLGSAPLDEPEFQATILGQLGEQRLLPAIEADLAGESSHAAALDGRATGALEGLHRRVAAAIFFESTGVASDKAAHLPELRFALGEPDLDITSIDNAAAALEARAFFIRRAGSDGYRVRVKPTLKKVVGDRRAGLDEADVAEALRRAIRLEADRAKALPVLPLVEDGADVADQPKLALAVLDPDLQWGDDMRTRLADWTRRRGGSDRYYPGAIVWLAARPGRALRERAELALAWKRVQEDVQSGALGDEFEPAEKQQVAGLLREAQDALRDEVWASYRYVVLLERGKPDDLRVIDLGNGHASSGASLSGRVVAALKAESLLSESVGAAYLERSWPPALKPGGLWPLRNLRQGFLDGSLIRLLDPEEVLHRQIAAFVERGEFGFASGIAPSGAPERLWFGAGDPLPAAEITFGDGTYLVTKARAEACRVGPKNAAAATASPAQSASAPLFAPPPPSPAADPSPAASEAPAAPVTLVISGAIPAEQWNRLGTKLLPLLRGGGDLDLSMQARATISARDSSRLLDDIRQVLRDLGLDGHLRVETR